MMNARAFGVGVLGVMLAAVALAGQTSGHYRDFRLGGDIASVSALTGLKASEVKTLHTRPAMLQELAWERPFSLDDEKVDPVQRITFSFYNDQLFRLVIDYDRNRTEGLTDADMIEAVSTMYGAPASSTVKAAPAPVPPVDATACRAKVAGWGNEEYTAVLCRASYGSGFTMVVTSLRLSALAKTAEAQALQLDERDAPQRELARRKREADEAQASRDKARLANKPTFTP